MLTLQTVFGQCRVFHDHPLDSDIDISSAFINLVRDKSYDFLIIFNHLLRYSFVLLLPNHSSSALLRAPTILIPIYVNMS